MYLLDAMGIGVLAEGISRLFMFLLVLIFVILIILTKSAAKKAYGPSDDESGEKRSDVKLKVLIILDCLFFVILTAVF